MVTLYIASSESYAGKSLLAMALGLKFQELGFKICYFKPVGISPVKVGDDMADEDALFIRQQLGMEEPLSEICPVVITPDLLRKAFRGEIKGLDKAIVEAHRSLCANRDLVLAGGVGSVLSTGAALGLTGARVAEILEAKAILVAKYESDLSIDILLSACQVLGDRLLGVVINNVASSQMQHVNHVIPYLEKQGIQVLGVLPRDAVLNSVSVGELADQLQAKVLCCQDRLDELVEHFSVGAMNVESALRYFRRIPNKAVITGGDRSDIQLAALETSTRCIILTGDLFPNSLILARAEELRVPMLLVPVDTLTSVETIEKMLGRLRVREPKKVHRAVALVDRHLDLEKLRESLGI